MKAYNISFIILIILLNFKNNNCYLFSVVMAIYNTGRYLDESISSLLNQTIGYKEIQIILVNDGSTDNSEEICKKYQKVYKNNIIYIKIEHRGVSTARNIGISYAKGEFINFLDPDDRWDSQAFQNINLFLKLNKNINFITGRLKFFEAANDYHPLDYKFYKTRIVNLTKEYNCIQSSSSTSFFRLSYIYGKKFEDGVPSGEDTRFVNSILLINPIMGLVREAIYYCRKRYDFSSRTQNQKRDIAFYFSTIFDVSKYLIDSSIVLYNKILPFIQFYIAYDLLFRIQSTSYKYLNSVNYKKYCSLLYDLLQKVDDKYIMEQRNVPNKFKILALSKKYKRDLRYNIIFQSGILKYLDYPLINLNIARNIIIWKAISINNNILHIEGIDSLWIPSINYFYFCEFGNNIFYPIYEYYSPQDFNSLYGIIEKGRIISFDIPLEKVENQTFYFYIFYKGDYCEFFPSPGMLTPLSNIPNSYYSYDNFILKIVEKRLTIFQYSELLENHFESQYCEELKKDGKNLIIKLRTKNKEYKKKYRKIKEEMETWIINDRKNQAGDNGEYFFRYLINKNPKHINIFFAIQKNCSDYIRLKKFGNVLDLNSHKYLETFLKANKIISSVPNLWVDNPFGEDQKYIKDLFNFEFIFIPSGIIKDNLSKYLNRINRNINTIVTSTKNEYKSLLSSDYKYKKNNIILTGISRFDNLEYFRTMNLHEAHRMILVMPTWRINIKGYKDSPIYETVHSDFFKSTKFFDFYNNLINDERLINVMKLYNYTGIFCLHPNFAAQWTDFDNNQQFQIKRKCNFQKLIIKGSLLVTDYSSVFFDFAYLKKAIIYAHFDYEEYRMNQYPEGFFNYKRDGFGPVYNNYNDTVIAIIESVKSHCKIKMKYLKKINKFFNFFDHNNNERIYNEISKRRNIKQEDFSTKIIYIILGFIMFSSFTLKCLIHFIFINKNLIFF